MNILKYIETDSALRDVYENKETLWINPSLGGRNLFSKYTIQVGSTGNLGLSIRIKS